LRALSSSQTPADAVADAIRQHQAQFSSPREPRDPKHALAIYNQTAAQMTQLYHWEQALQAGEHVPHARMQSILHRWGKIRAFQPPHKWAYMLKIAALMVSLVLVGLLKHTASI